MLSHDNLTWGSKMVLGVIRAPGFNRLPVPGEEVIMSYLPHSEIASQTVSITFSKSAKGFSKVAVHCFLSTLLQIWIQFLPFIFNLNFPA